jgi:hypothetical protein
MTDPQDDAPDEREEEGHDAADLEPGGPQSVDDLGDFA